MARVLEIPCAWSLVTAPAVEPVTLEEVKAQARILDDNTDGILASAIVTAREAAEQHMGRGLITQTWQYVLAAFANVIELPMAAPLQSATVQYYDGDGTLQTLATTYYSVDTVARPGRVVLKPGQSWPSVQSDRRDGAVIVTYVVGWTSADLVPERIKRGIAQYVTYLEMDRDGLGGYDALQSAERCWSDRISWTQPRWCD